MQTLLKKTGAYRLLKNEGDTQGFSHAYLLLFEDSRHLRAGLKVFARLFFDCESPSTPSQKRRAELIEEESFSDCLFYPAEGKKLMVEDAERILEESTLAPVEGDKKLFVLADFAEANAQTQNKLLKLLEEPPKGVYFLLGTTSAFSVLQTVLSRTKKLEILPFTEGEVAAFLERKYADTYDIATLTACAATSGGNLGEACAILEGGYYTSLIDCAYSLLLSPSHKLPTLVKSVGETPHKKELLNLLRILCRDALLLKLGEGSLLLKGEKTRTKEVANAFTKAALLYAQEALLEGEKQIKFNAIFSQCIETCIANIHAKNKENI